MTPKHLPSAMNQRDRWMVSYVDVLTILLIFFLVATAKSLEAPKAHAVLPAQPPIPRQAEQPRTTLLLAQQRLRDRGLDPKLEPRGLVISLSQVILFPSGEDAVSFQALPTLAQIADVLRDIPNDVRLVGHADPVPIHNRRFRSNWDLSMARSQKILDLLSNSYGIPESRLSIASYGPYRPAAPNNTVDGRASNRRVEIVILDDVAPARPVEEGRKTKLSLEPAG
jgi:outer membrane protein OmpA-like peptidoglycan-associated protein